MIIGSKLLFIKNLPSTNTYSASLIRENEVSEGTIVYTDYQSAGQWTDQGTNGRAKRIRIY